MIEPMHAVILGAVEGLTEFLPVSSTGHLILSSRVLGLHGNAVKTFEVVIQAGALVAVLGLYRERVASMVRGLLGKDPNGLRLLLLILTSFLPAAVIGLLAHRVVKAYLFGPWPVVWALAIGGVAMILIDRWARKRTTYPLDCLDHLSYKQALFIGCAQCIALWPGTSRAMVSIVAAMVCGLSAKQAAEYSFLLALPTLGAATFFDGVVNGKALFEQISVFAFACGMFSALGVAALAIRGFVQYLGKHGLEIFGWYRIGLAGLILAVAWQR